MSSPSRSPRPRARLAAVLLLPLGLLPLAGPAAADGHRAAGYRPPVPVPVADPFRAPATPFGPGNRGLEYHPDPGTPVLASARGEVVFAGQVGGSLHVTVLHPDGIRTSYSFLAELQVVVGQQVDQGDPVGLSGPRLHFGARRGDEYFDPASLFGTGDVQVELVPFEVPPGSTPEGERMALRLIAPGPGGGGGLGLPDLGAVGDWLSDGADALSHYVTEVNPAHWAVDTVRSVASRVLFPGPCTGGDTAAAVPAGDRVALTVGGLGSTSESASIDRLDLAGLGYRTDEVLRFSYAGGHIPGTGAGDLPGVPATHYDSADTQGDLHRAGGRLADLVEEVAGAHPAARVDVYAHSMGGVVARLALAELERRGFPLARLGLVATLGSPHRGADLATLVGAARRSEVGDHGLDLLESAVATGLEPDAVAIAQLSETSDLVAELDAAGVPDDVELVSVAARGDVVVPSPRTRVSGARNVTVPDVGWDAHSDMVASEVTDRELRLALAGLPPRCVGAWDVLQDETTGRGIALAEDAVGLAAAGLP